MYYIHTYMKNLFFEEIHMYIIKFYTTLNRSNTSVLTFPMYKIVSQS